MSPLQYQKQLRLQEARRLMLGEGLDAAQAAFRVGYESPSQFSREYRSRPGALHGAWRARATPKSTFTSMCEFSLSRSYEAAVDGQSKSDSNGLVRRKHGQIAFVAEPVG
jgi:AraC-like DNA-binding protein